MSETTINECTEAEILALVEFASIFAGQNDVRKYLNQVVTTSNGDSTDIVAADGHRLVKITIPKTTKLPETISLTSIKNAVKTKLFNILTTPESDLGIYPNVERLIPKDRTFEQQPVGINASYLASAMSGLAKLSKKLHGGNFVGVKITQLSKDNANVFEQSFSDGRIKVLILIMPMRL